MRGFIRKGGLGLSLVARMQRRSGIVSTALGVLLFIKKGYNFA